jgi:hypothetical protein
VAVLRCPGVFVVPIPEGWEVRGVPGSHYVITPVVSRRGEEVRLAVFPREPEPLGEREGAQRLLELLGELRVDPRDEEISFRARYSADAHRAFAWFPAFDEDGHDIDCLAAVVVMTGAVVACTAKGSPRRTEIISTAELLVAAMTVDDGRHTD